MSQKPSVIGDECRGEKYESGGSGLRRTGGGANSPMTYVEDFRVSS